MIGSKYRHPSGRKAIVGAFFLLASRGGTILRERVVLGPSVRNPLESEKNKGQMMFNEKSTRRVIPMLLSLSVAMGVLAGAAAASTHMPDPDPNQADALPTAEELHRRSIEAVGTADARSRVRSRVTKAVYPPGEFELGSDTDVEIFEVSPGKRANRLTYRGRLVYVVATEGKHVWMVQDSFPPKLADETRTEDFIAESRLGIEESTPELYESMETVAKTEFAGEPAYEVKLVRKDGAALRHFYALESGLLIGKVSPARPEEGVEEARIVMSDFREVDGLTYPFRFEMTLVESDETRLMIVESIVHNTEIDPAIFEMPEELEK